MTIRNTVRFECAAIIHLEENLQTARQIASCSRESFPNSLLSRTVQTWTREAADSAIMLDQSFVASVMHASVRALENSRLNSAASANRGYGPSQPFCRCSKDRSPSDS